MIPMKKNQKTRKPENQNNIRPVCVTKKITNLFVEEAMKTFALCTLILFIALVMILIYVANSKTEGFDLYDSYLDRNSYIMQSKQKYNPFSETANVTQSNFMGSNDPKVINQANSTMQSALQTSDLSPSRMMNSLLGINPAISRASLSPPNQAFLQAQKCESLKTRQSCAKLDDPSYANCGVCIKGGTPTTYDNANNHIGGMLVLPNDVEKAETLVAGTGVPPTYYPSVGSCPPGFFFTTSTDCAKQANRLDCDESGKSGGFNGGKTIEGNQVVAQKCAQVVNASGANTFIYEPKPRSFNVNLRVLAPYGTGNCKVYVYNSNQQQVGYALNSTPGEEFVVLVQNVQENSALNVVVMLEAPYRYGGDPELFQVQLANPMISPSDAAAVCARYGSVQANVADLQIAFNNGAQVCNAGWTSDAGLAWPSQTVSAACGMSDVNLSADTQGDSWCVGLKPPQSTNMLDSVRIANWYEGEGSSVSQVSMYSSPNPYIRAVLMQWEMSSGNSVRTVGFENTIKSINGIGPSDASMGGFSNMQNYGTFAIPTTITNPTFDSSTSEMLGSRTWIWSNQPLSQQVQFGVVVPGIFLDSYYLEDREVSSFGPLIGDSSVASMVVPNPCINQATGSYTLTCLQSAFVAAGGDINKGTLVTQNGGLNQLNNQGDLTEITKYLDELYTIATTGKDLNGNPVGRNPEETQSIVNDASQKLFGFSIATPCEVIAKDMAGNIMIVPKKGTQIDSFCLDYLWTNTGSEQEQGIGDSMSNIKHTYTSIGQRFSGLRSTEGTATSRSQNQFMLCQRTGSLAPIQANGQPNLAAIAQAQALGTIANIQNFYNNVFNTANSPGSGPTQATAVNQCYGLIRKQ